MDYFVSEVSEAEVRREKAKARELRQTQWWKQKLHEGVCYYCQGHFSPDELTMDHVVPVVRGGKSVKANIAVACKSCNNKKKYLLPMEWQEYLDNLNKDSS